jgi:uncharacterized protein YbaP (TraB family)
MPEATGRRSAATSARRATRGRSVAACGLALACMLLAPCAPAAGTYDMVAGVTAPAVLPNPHEVAAGMATAPGAMPRRLPFFVARRGDITLYLLGTLHVGDPADYPAGQPFRDEIAAALAASGTLALELSPDDLVDSQGDVQRYGVCSRACLPRLLPAGLWRQLARRLAHNPAALAEIRKTRPWLASLMLQTYDSRNAGLQTEYGTEVQLENLHRGRIVGLETLNEQMLAFVRLSLPEQWEMLRQDLAQTPAESIADIRTLHALWLAGEADAMAAWDRDKTLRMAHNRALADSVDEQIVYRRNERFAARILLLADPALPVFVAIGALHLGGPRGVLALLKRYGYAVQAR